MPYQKYRESGTITYLLQIVADVRRLKAQAMFWLGLPQHHSLLRALDHNGVSGGASGAEARV